MKYFHLSPRRHTTSPTGCAVQSQVLCQMWRRPLPGPPLSRSAAFFFFFFIFFQTEPVSPPGLVSTESERTPGEGSKQTHLGAVWPCCLRFCTSAEVNSHLLGLQPGRSTGWVSPARVQSTSPFKLLELASPPWTREGFLDDLPADLHQQTVGSPFSKKYLMFSCWSIWAGIFFFQVPFPKYLLLKTFFFWCGK